jgi:large subunit ribosomal protein L40e
MFFSKKNKTRSSRMRSEGRRTSKKRNMMRGGFNIFIRDALDRTISMDVESTTTIFSIKSKIQDRFYIDPSKQVLTFWPNRLADDQTVGGAGIKKDNEIRLLILVDCPLGSGQKCFEQTVALPPQAAEWNAANIIAQQKNPSRPGWKPHWPPGPQWP